MLYSDPLEMSKSSIVTEGQSVESDKVNTLIVARVRVCLDKIL
jgi:hypothetical protein